MHPKRLRYASDITTPGARTTGSARNQQRSANDAEHSQGLAQTRLQCIVAGLAAATVAAVSAGERKTAEPYAEAKSIIEDMERIATPNGVQEIFKARIGGIDQWISVRGKDRDNPVLLFVHGGPASPAMPVSWTFQRPWEEYFFGRLRSQKGMDRARSHRIALLPLPVGMRRRRIERHR